MIKSALHLRFKKEWKKKKKNGKYRKTLYNFRIAKAS